MTIGQPAQLAIKWANGTWTYYRCDPTRSWEKVQEYFKKLSNFRFAHLYAYDTATKSRLYKLGYFDRVKSEFNRP